MSEPRAPYGSPEPPPVVGDLKKLARKVARLFPPPTEGSKSSGTESPKSPESGDTSSSSDGGPKPYTTSDE